MLCAAYTDHNNRIHAETIVGGAAALTGEFALRATGLPIPAAGFVFGDPINQILFEGGDGHLTLWDLLASAAAAIGVANEDLPDAREIFRRIAAAIAVIAGKGESTDNFPPLSVPTENYPREWSPNAGPRLRATVEKIAAKRTLTPRQTAYALCMATGDLIKQGKDVLAPKVAFRLAIEIMFSTAKMAPLIINDDRISEVPRPK